MDFTEDFTKEEEIMNAVLHGIGLGLALAALVVLVVLASLHGDVWYITGYSIYGSTLVLLYLSSTLYHSFPQGTVKNIFEIFDHASIFLLIAGTYTPITLISLKGTLGWSLFGAVWGLAVVGVIFKVFWIKKFVLLSTVIYVVMGWLVIFAIRPLLEALSTASLIFLVAGGLLYTVGTVFFVWKGFKYHHAVWHLFVLAGSVCHFFTMVFLLPL